MRTVEILSFLDEKNIKYEIRGKKDFDIFRFCVPQNLENNTLIWVKKKDNVDWKVIDAHDNILIVTSEDIEATFGRAVIIVDHSKAVFFGILEHFWGQTAERGIASTAKVFTDKIGQNVSIGEYSVIGKAVEIGDNVTIGSNVVLENTVLIGDNSSIFSGTVIGSDGFGFFKDDSGNNQRVPHYGRVVIGQNVEIGANCVINRGTMGDTVIGDYTKIDSHNHIPHNVVIGKNCLLTSGAQLCGSSQLGDETYLAPNCCIKNQVKVGKGCMVNIGTVITEDLPDGVIAQGKRRIKMDYRKILNM